MAVDAAALSGAVAAHPTENMRVVGFRKVSPMPAALRTDGASGQTEIMGVARACAGR